MKPSIRRAAAIAMSLACSFAFAQNASKPVDGKSGPAPGSPEAQVAARFAEKSGGQKPDQVFKGRGGLYEVLVQGQLLYVDPEVTFVLSRPHDRPAHA